MLDLGEAGNRARQRVKIQDCELVVTGSEGFNRENQH